LGGVWVAHPDVTEPERVLIRNSSNDKFVVGALFRRERDIPGPQIQISSDAAEALGMLAGAPAQLEVVALRKEAVPIATETPALATLPEDTATPLEETPEIETASLDPLAGAAAAIATAPENEAAIVTEAAATSKPAQTREELEKAYVQIGIFSQEFNADRTANILRGMGMVPTTRQFERDGKSFWRLLVGPATSEKERNQLLAQIKKQGYTDAYPVAN
jgi:cell division septation protein DedD